MYHWHFKEPIQFDFLISNNILQHNTWMSYLNEKLIKLVSKSYVGIYTNMRNTVWLHVSTLACLDGSSDTRKPSWRKGKRATAVRVWRPLAKKSTANRRYAISYFLAALLTVCEIFSGVEVENSHFHPLYCDCSPLAEERPAMSM